MANAPFQSKRSSLWGKFIHTVTVATYVTPSALLNLKYYKYRSIDRSFLSSHILRHYWNFCVKLFPLWMAPNLITLTGFGFVLFNFLLMCIFMPRMEGYGDGEDDGIWQRWPYLSFGIGMWLYSTFDNVDGKQARRTGSSSPLGELFDHGCDALNCSVGCLVQAAGLGLGYSWRSIKIMYFTATAFYVTTWEEYHTHVLYLGYVNGPTEGLLLASLSSIITGLFGPGIWRVSTHHALIKLGLAGLLQGTAAWNFLEGQILIDTLLDLMILLMWSAHVPVSLYFVYRARRGDPAELLNAATQLVPLLVLFSAIYFWLTSPNSIVMSSYYFIVFLVACGMVFGRMVSKIILAHVTMTEFPYFSTVMLIPLVCGTGLVRFGLLGDFQEKMYIWSFLLMATYNYLHWALIVIHRFCDFLDIYCLSIKHVGGDSKKNGNLTRGRDTDVPEPQKEANAYTEANGRLRERRHAASAPVE